MGIRRAVRLAARLAAGAALLLSPALAPAHVAAGETLENRELETLSGGRKALLARDVVNVLVFFRPGQERSADTLQHLAECEAALARRSVRMVALVSAEAPRAEVQALVAEAKVRSPVLLDAGDEIYGRLELRQHPMIVIVDRSWRVAAFEPYVRLRYCEIVLARVSFLLGEIREAQLEAVLHPPRAAFPTEVAGGSAARYVKMGEKELAKGNCAVAVDAFDHALAEDPKNAAALAGKERCKARGGK
jgi:cytochrome c-type biogenesis protein CcmH/NrfG